MTKIDKWDRHFLRIARECALMSKDPSSQIGAVIVQDRRQVASGYNGFPPGIADDDRLNDRDAKLELVVHAEANACLNAGREAAKGGTLYLWGFEGPPCTSCAKHALAVGITRVVASGTKTPDRWAESLAAAENLLREAGVALRYYPMNEVVGNDRTHQERKVRLA